MKVYEIRHDRNNYDAPYDSEGWQDYSESSSLGLYSSKEAALRAAKAYDFAKTIDKRQFNYKRHGRLLLEHTQQELVYLKDDGKLIRWVTIIGDERTNTYEHYFIMIEREVID